MQVQVTLANTSSFAQRATTGARLEMSRMERMMMEAGGLQVLVGKMNDGVLQVQVCCMPFFFFFLKNLYTSFENVGI